MPLSRIDIWNMALSKIGSTEKVQAEEETTPEAEQCKLHYPQALRECLAARVWPWATKQTELAELNTSRNGWTHVYALPADCITPVALLWQGGRHALTPAPHRIPFTVTLNDNGDGQVLCTDLPSSAFECLEYVAEADYPPMYPPAFTSALAWRLAAELAGGLKKDPRLMGDCLRMFDQGISVASAQAGNIGHDRKPVSPTLAARGDGCIDDRYDRWRW